MGEARRRKLLTGAAGAEPDQDASQLVTREQQEVLVQLSEWNRAFPWEPPPSEQAQVPASEVMFYLVDTRTLWNVIGGVCEAGAGRLMRLAESSPPSIYQRAPGLAGLSLLQASAAGARLADAAGQDALTFAGFYAACTETYAQAQDRFNSCRGHWFVLLYHLADGSRTVRPLFLAEPVGRKLTAQEHVMVVVDAMAQDLHGGPSALSERIKAAGGLQMADALRARVSGRRPH
jgi:hypothetical protein